jgi:hypothetical protein
MRYLFLLALVLALCLPAPAAHAAGCDSGRFHEASGAVVANCYVVTASVAGHACAPSPFIDGGGIGTATARQMAERTARIACVEEYEAGVGIVHSGSIGSDGNDRAYSVGLDEVRILSVERR